MTAETPVNVPPSTPVQLLENLLPPAPHAKLIDAIDDAMTKLVWFLKIDRPRSTVNLEQTDHYNIDNISRWIAYTQAMKHQRAQEWSAEMKLRSITCLTFTRLVHNGSSSSAVEGSGVLLAGVN